MGCDFSKITKKSFDDEALSISKSISDLKLKQQSVELSVETMITPKEPKFSIDSIQKQLIPKLEKIEALLLEMKNSKEYNNANDKDKDKNNEKNNKFQVSTKAESTEFRSRNESPAERPEKDVISILDDPMIKAMIEKNRQRFVGQKRVTN